MSTFSQEPKNARAASVDKDKPSAEEIKAADDAVSGQETVPADNPNQPTETLDETEQERGDRHVASTELPAGDVTDPDTQSDTSPAEDAKEKVVPGAAAGPDAGGTIVNDQGKVAYAPPGSVNAAFNGVQQDASGHVDSVGTDNSAASGTRV